MIGIDVDVPLVVGGIDDDSELDDEDDTDGTPAQGRTEDSNAEFDTDDADDDDGTVVDDDVARGAGRCFDNFASPTGFVRSNSSNRRR